MVAHEYSINRRRLPRYKQEFILWKLSVPLSPLQPAWSLTWSWLLTVDTTGSRLEAYKTSRNVCVCVPHTNYPYNYHMPQSLPRILIISYNILSLNRNFHSLNQVPLKNEGHENGLRLVSEKYVITSWSEISRGGRNFIFLQVLPWLCRWMVCACDCDFGPHYQD